MPSQVLVCSILLRSTCPQTKSGVKTQATVSANRIMVSLRLCIRAHARSLGHVMLVMAASVSRGGVNPGFLLRVARGTWWNRHGSFLGSREAAAPATARKFRATGTRSALGERGGAALTRRMPTRRGASAHSTVFSRLAPGGRGRSQRSRSARGRVSGGAKSPIPHPTRFLWFPTCSAA